MPHDAAASVAVEEEAELDPHYVFLLRASVRLYMVVRGEMDADAAVAELIHSSADVLRPFIKECPGCGCQPCTNMTFCKAMLAAVERRRRKGR